MQTPHTTTEGEIKEIWERLTKCEASNKSAHHRLDGLEEVVKSVNSLAVSTNQLATETKALREDFKATDERLEALEIRPLKRYDMIVTVVVTAVVSGLIGFLLNMILG